MIARISTEGQYKLTSTCLDRLNEVDNKLVDAVAKNNEGEFQRLFAQMLEIVRKEGQPVPVDELVHSDIILPPPDTSLEDARHLFQGEGIFEG